jgi:hypothetical protein
MEQKSSQKLFLSLVVPAQHPQSSQQQRKNSKALVQKSSVNSEQIGNSPSRCDLPGSSSSPLRRLSTSLQRLDSGNPQTNVTFPTRLQKLRIVLLHLISRALAPHRVASHRSNIDEKEKKQSHKSKTTLLYDHRITTSNGMETKPEIKTKTTTINLTADLLRQLHTPSSSSKEGLRTNKQGNKKQRLQRTNNPQQQQQKPKGRKKNQKNREKRGKITCRFSMRKIPQRHEESSKTNHRNGKKDRASSAIAREPRPVEPPWLQRSVDT